MLRPYFGYLVEPDQSMTSTRGGRFASQKADCCSAGLELDRALRGLYSGLGFGLAISCSRLS